MEDHYDIEPVAVPDEPRAGRVIDMTLVVNWLPGERHDGCDCQGQRQKQQSAEKSERSATILRPNAFLNCCVFVVASKWGVFYP